jgi:hypothetical protein
VTGELALHQHLAILLALSPVAWGILQLLRR